MQLSATMLSICASVIFYTTQINCTDMREIYNLTAQIEYLKRELCDLRMKAMTLNNDKKRSLSEEKDAIRGKGQREDIKHHQQRRLDDIERQLSTIEANNRTILNKISYLEKELSNKTRMIQTIMKAKNPK
ncbi:hypothetical protein EDEG_02002 [Edhazardia aedis USNM 41457]|uniref:Uncharacterized protein n=1 Tax=Edhazardia aedis (strain USNM 41457) TaxID=1003232 RepID=J9DQS6_EDHAE|nr:hypothetical protein EDEG_02002 [Edhazardia aedis USNM 41457]|eukprot:EJW03672.1 hypothetical protein EDEG_02002 [Edhazardia aedis USNM 41457]